ncbi:MAG: hypothetical protein ACLTER_02440 [Ruminococcus sp.]
MKNYAMKMCSVKRLERTELEMPVAAADQVVVKIEYCGICGSDMHFSRMEPSEQERLRRISFWDMRVLVPLSKLEKMLQP